MTPVNAALAELLLAVRQAEQRGVAVLLRAAADAGPGQPLFAFGILEDHRVEVAGDLADAMDRIQPGLGGRLMQAMFPESNLAISEEEAAEEIRQAMAAAAAADRQPPAAAPGLLQ